MGKTLQSLKMLHLIHRHPHVPDQHDQYACVLNRALREVPVVGHKDMTEDIGVVTEIAIHVNHHVQFNQRQHIDTSMKQHRDNLTPGCTVSVTLGMRLDQIGGLIFHLRSPTHPP